MNLKGMKFTLIAWSAIEGLSLKVDGLGFGSKWRLQRIVTYCVFKLANLV
jgi:hypothetical protein